MTQFRRWMRQFRKNPLDKAPLRKYVEAAVAESKLQLDEEGVDWTKVGFLEGYAI